MPENEDMLYELIREIIRKVARDKILMGLVVLGVLAIFYGGMNQNTKNDSVGDQPAEATGGKAAQQSSDHVTVEPSLATDFVKWWLASAMDYSPSSSEQSHERAFGWMTPQATAAFREAFWSPTISEGVTRGRVVAAFQTTGITAEAVNPDGTVVVKVTGTLVVQNGGQPMTQQVATDYLIAKERDGLRVAGIYNRVSPIASN
jgi:hypothetical protein